MTAALVSRSNHTPYRGHCHVRTWSGLGPSLTPHCEQLCEVGSNLPIRWNCRPLLDHAVRNVAPEGAPRFRAIALEALGELYRARQHPEAAAPLIAEAQELRQALSANAR